MLIRAKFFPKKPSQSPKWRKFEVKRLPDTPSPARHLPESEQSQRRVPAALKLPPMKSGRNERQPRTLTWSASGPGRERITSTLGAGKVEHVFYKNERSECTKRIGVLGQTTAAC